VGRRHLPGGPRADCFLQTNSGYKHTSTPILAKSIYILLSSIPGKTDIRTIFFDIFDQLYEFSEKQENTQINQPKLVNLI